MRSVVFVLFIFISIPIFGQNSVTLKHRADMLLHKKAECLKKKKKDSFYYIQIYNGPDVNKAKRILKEFVSRYPNSKAFVTWENPEYKVWVGEYFTRFEVERAMLLIRDEFPDAMIVFPRIH